MVVEIGETVGKGICRFCYRPIVLIRMGRSQEWLHDGYRLDRECPEAPVATPIHSECSWHPGEYHGICSEAVR